MNKIATFGEKLRVFREKSELTLKELSSILNIDTSLLAKIERDERNPTKQLIKKISEHFKVNEQELQSTILSDQIAYKILDEDADISILREAEEKVSYFKSIKNYEKG